MAEHIQQIYATHCTYGNSAIERRQGDLAERVLGYSARASSYPQAELRKHYRTVERYLYYHLPKDATADVRLQETEGTAPKRMVFIPEIGGFQVIAHVSYRQKDVANRVGSYFAHVLLNPKRDEKRHWSALDCLRLWNCRSWVREDTSSIPFELPELESLEHFADSTSAIVHDEMVLRFFTESSYYPSALGDDPQVAERWRSMRLEDRQSFLEKSLLGFLEAARQPRQSLLLVMEPEVAALYFYAIARLIPHQVGKTILSLSTFEPHTDRLTTTLAATCFADNTRTDVPAEQYQRGHVLNSFTSRSTKWNSTATGYAAAAVRWLTDQGWTEVDRCLREFDSLKASRIDHLIELHNARGIADTLLNPQVPVSANVSNHSPLSLTFIASHITRVLTADQEGQLLQRLKESEPHFVALVKLLPQIQSHSKASQLREALLDQLPEHLYAVLLGLDIPDADKVAALALFMRHEGRLPANMPAIWPTSLPPATAEHTGYANKMAVLLLKEVSAPDVERIRESVPQDRLLAFCLDLVSACDGKDFRKDKQLQRSIQSLSLAQSLDLIAALRGRTEHLSIGARDEITTKAKEAVLGLPDSPESIPRKLDVLATVRNLLVGTYDRRLTAWITIRDTLVAARDRQPQRGVFGRKTSSEKEDRDAIGAKLAPAICDVMNPPGQSVPHSREFVTRAVECVQVLARVLQCPDSVLPNEMERKLDFYVESGWWPGTTPPPPKPIKDSAKSTKPRFKPKPKSRRLIAKSVSGITILAVTCIGLYFAAGFVMKWFRTDKTVVADAREDVEKLPIAPLKEPTSVAQPDKTKPRQSKTDPNANEMTTPAMTEAQELAASATESNGDPNGAASSKSSVETPENPITNSNSSKQAQPPPATDNPSTPDPSTQVSQSPPSKEVNAVTEFLERAKQLMEKGQEKEAFDYIYAATLISDPTEMVKKFAWAPALKRPVIGVRWGIGLEIDVPKKYPGSYFPVGEPQQLPMKGTLQTGSGPGRVLGASAGDGSAMTGPGDMSAGAARGVLPKDAVGADVLSHTIQSTDAEAMKKATGELGEKLMEHLRTRISEGLYGKTLQEFAAKHSQKDVIESGESALSRPFSDVGIVYLGQGQKDTLLKAAAQQGIDILVHFNVKIEPKNDKVENTTTIVLFRVPEGTRVVYCTVSNIEVQMGRTSKMKPDEGQDPVSKAFTKLFPPENKDPDKQLIVRHFQEVTDEDARSCLESILACLADNREAAKVAGQLRSLAAIRLLCHLHPNLGEQFSVQKLFRDVLGPEDGAKLAEGTKEEQLLVLQKLLPQVKE